MSEPQTGNLELRIATVDGRERVHAIPSPTTEQEAAQLHYQFNNMVIALQRNSVVCVEGTLTVYNANNITWMTFPEIPFLSPSLRQIGAGLPAT